MKRKKDKLYILKVMLSHDKKIWRRIEIPGSQSLDQLHEIIFDAFNRFDPHLYSFYLTRPGSKSRRRFAQAEEYTHPAGIEDDFSFSEKKLHDASKTAIADLNLKEKSRFEYLFDFGDDWLHEIMVEKILDIFPKKNYPLITKQNGISPPQYPNFEEEADEYDIAELEKMRAQNGKVLDEFQQYLEAKKLSTKTVEKHTSNINFYINEFLLYEEPLEPREGSHLIGDFLGNWFIRKAMWSSVTSIKANIASLKHFYTFLLQQGKIKQPQLDEMKQQIKECKADWFEAVQEYDNMASDSGELV